MFEKVKNSAIFNDSGLFISSGLFSTPKYMPLGSVVGSCVFDCDATVRNSYSGGNFKNIELTPSDLEAQAQYDLEGIGASAPTFVGNVNNPNAYFLFDGGDRFSGVNALSAFLNSIHKTIGGSDFTFVMTYYHINANAILMTNRQAGTANIGVMMYTLASSNDLHLIQRGDSANSADAQSVTAMTPSSWNFIAAAHEHSTGNTKLWVNSSTGLELNRPFATSTGNASATNFSIGAYGDGTVAVANTSRIKGAHVFNKYLTDKEILLIMQTLNGRYNGLLSGFL